MSCRSIVKSFMTSLVSICLTAAIIGFLVSVVMRLCAWGNFPSWWALFVVIPVAAGGDAWMEYRRRAPFKELDRLAEMRRKERG